ncbi:hypothetical protein GGI05_003733, partial [Coemansia sp. RSA 2603]
MRITIAKRPIPGAVNTSSQPSAGSRYPFTVEVSENATVDDLKAAVAKQVKSMYPDRQRLSY